MKLQPIFTGNINNTNLSFKKRKDKYSMPKLFIGKGQNNLTSMTYSKPVTLKKALYDIVSTSSLNEGIVGEKTVISNFITDLSSNKKLINKKVVGLVGYGSSAVAFETADGKVLKLTSGSHFPLNRPHEIFDVPLYASGKHGKTHFYLEEKLYQHSMPQYFVSTVKDMIVSTGYKASDFYSNDTHQIGIAKNGRVYLLDAECAKYKTLLHAAFDKAKKFIRKMI